MVKKILVIEDEKDLAELLIFNLEKEGFKISCSYDGLDGLDLARREEPDLILLDLMLPGLMGTEVCKELRRDPRTAHIPVLMLTAKGEEIDRVVGFELGADDYLVKPFSMRELLLRIRAILRRCEGQASVASGALVSMGGIIINKERHQVLSEGNEVELTTIEFKLLLYLVERPGRVLSRELLLQNVWSYNNMGDTRTVDTHVTRLRGKLGAPGELIKTVRGFGYKIEG
ncbi:MAG TPA: response regulator transcription factor [Desulfuromonadaceae bacterium]|jgi:two-component system phosphate regulon response regulator PhoB